MAENLINAPIITNGDMSSALESLPQDLSRIDIYSIQAVWTGSPSGTIKIQVSVNGSTFTDLADSEEAISGAGDFLWVVTDVGYDKMKVVYTPSSGSGTLNVQYNGKGDWR